MKKLQCRKAMQINNEYKTRSTRFMGTISTNGWTIKVYGISIKNAPIPNELIEHAKPNLTKWLEKSNDYPLPTYKIATLIIHEGREGVFTLLNWWIDENMLQNHVYFSTYDKPEHFEYFSDRGIMCCVWELAVMWFERNAWIKHVLSKNSKPDFTAYLNETFNAEV